MFDMVDGHLKCFLGGLWLINRSLLIGAPSQSDEIQTHFLQNETYELGHVVVRHG